MPRSALGQRLERASRLVTDWTGSSWAFAIAVLVILTWLVTGPFFHYSDTWQLVINTATMIITFLMMFLIQKTQNRDAKAAPRSRHTAGEGQDIDHVYLDPRDGQPTATTLGLC